ncbi:hypothetical protein PENTCL1PPCAC_9359, partial [Pristionchus entomophagus]
SSGPRGGTFYGSRVFARCSRAACTRLRPCPDGHPSILFILTTDFLVTAIFTIDAIAIMRHQGSWQSSNLIGDRWARFDLFMLAMHYLSVGLHLLELFAL